MREGAGARLNCIASKPHTDATKDTAYTTWTPRGVGAIRTSANQNGYITTNRPTRLAGSVGLTVSCRFNIHTWDWGTGTGTGGNRQFWTIWKDGARGSGGIVEARYLAKSYNYLFNWNQYNHWTDVTNYYSTRLNTWFTETVVFRWGSPTLMYVDGKLWTPSGGNTAISSQATVDLFTIGDTSYNVGAFWQFAMVWNRPLSQSEVQQHVAQPYDILRRSFVLRGPSTVIPANNGNFFLMF